MGEAKKKAEEEEAEKLKAEQEMKGDDDDKPNDDQVEEPKKRKLKKHQMKMMVMNQTMKRLSLKNQKKKMLNNFKITITDFGIYRVLGIDFTFLLFYFGSILRYNCLIIIVDLLFSSFNLNKNRSTL